jgi:hypothetical protein
MISGQEEPSSEGPELLRDRGAEDESGVADGQGRLADGLEDAVDPRDRLAGLMWLDHP